MRTEIASELKSLRLYGMASAWDDLLGQGETAALQSARWLLEHLLQAEGVDRAMRSVSYQMKAARFPMHRDLAGFDFEASAVERVLVDDELALAGSANLDGRSLFLNYEMMIAFYDQPAVAAFARWVEARRKECRPYLYRRPGLMREVAEGLLLWLAFQL